MPPYDENIRRLFCIRLYSWDKFTFSSKKFVFPILRIAFYHFSGYNFSTMHTLRRIRRNFPERMLSMSSQKSPYEKSRHLREQIRRRPAVFAVYLVLRLIVLGTLVSSIVRGEYESAFVCLLVLALFMLPFFIQQNFGIELPSTLEIIILLFIFASEILGELGCYFIRYPNWDSILHTTTGFLCAATGFALVDILNRNNKIKFDLSPVYVALAAFCFSMTVGVLWEFFEFGMDRLFHMDMQKDTVITSITSVMLDPTNKNIPITIDGITSVSVNGQDLGFHGYLDIGLYDTMEDLFVNFIGAVVFSVIGYFYIKHRGKGKIAQAFIPKLAEPGAAPGAQSEGVSENS